LPTRRFRSALASFFSSLLVATGALAAGADEVRLQLVELEAGLAKKPDVYLVLDPVAGRLAVKARGLELSSVSVSEIARLEFRPMFGEAVAPPLRAPALWTVSQGPGDTDRETIAPTTLRPYSEEEERSEPSPGGASAPVKKPGEDERPSSYRVSLDNGWQLLFVNESPRLGWFRRLGAAVRDGWQRLRGEQPAHPPLVALVVAPDDARRLHHLFRSGRAILVVPPPA
jgi:hypothetical protein